MLTNHLIIIPYHLPRDWPADYIEQTVQRLCRRNKVICFYSEEKISLRQLFARRRSIFSRRKRSANVYDFYPVLFLGLEQFNTAKNINLFVNVLILKLCSVLVQKQHNIRSVVAWFFSPFPRFFLSIMSLGTRFVSLYDCVDYTWYPSKALTKAAQAEENTFILACLCVTVNSQSLYRLHSKTRQDIHIVPQGFRLSDYRLYCRHPDRLKIKIKPTIGYIGAINYRLDFALLFSLVKRHPEWQFVLWGPLQLNESEYPYHVDEWFARLQQFPNVKHGQSLHKDAMPSVVHTFDVCIIPYNTVLAFNKYCYPMKLHEYFYMGKPVVTTTITEMQRFPELVHIGDSTKQWEAHIKRLLQNQWPKNLQRKQKRIACNNSWEQKIGAISTIVLGLEHTMH